jgi:hypothetical protein
VVLKRIMNIPHRGFFSRDFSLPTEHEREGWAGAIFVSSSKILSFFNTSRFSMNLLYCKSLYSIANFSEAE